MPLTCLTLVFVSLPLYPSRYVARHRPSSMNFISVARRATSFAAGS